MNEVKYLPSLKNEEGKIIKKRDIVDRLVDDLTSIEDSAVLVEFHLSMSRFKDAFEETMKDAKYKEFAMKALDDEMSNLNQSKLELKGATLSKATVHTKYDFTSCNHPVLDFLNSVNVKFKDYVKLIEAELKLIPEVETTLVDDVPTITGGKKQIIIDSNETIANLQFFIQDAQTLIDTLDSEDSFPVNKPAVIKTTGIKILKK